MSPPDTDRLADLVRAKRACLAQVRDLGHRQLELIQEGDMTRLLDLLAAKQRLIHQLQRLERALDPFRAEDPTARVWRDPRRRQQCAEDIRECEALLAEILSREKHSEAALVHRRDETATRLQGVHLATQARGAYVGETPLAAGHVNLLSEA
jgi:hypothetical protein